MIAELKIIATILSVAQKLFGLKGELSKAKAERKQRVSEFLSGIAQTIEDTAGSLRQGNYPHAKCQELLSHSQTMESAIGDLIGTQQAADLGRQLHEVWEIERLYGQLEGKPPEEKTRNLAVMDQAAGLFRATAAYVRVSP
jgi:hypothetical protein